MMKEGILVLTVLIIATTFSSCKKYRLNRDTTSSADYSAAENMFNDVFRVADEAAKEEGDMKGAFAWTLGSCAAVSVNPAWPDTTFPKTITVDFGSTNCTGNDYRKRRGKIILDVSAPYRQAGSIVTITPQNYFVNDNKVEGTKKLTNNGRNSNGNLNYTVEVINGKVTTPDGGVIEWESTRNNEWIEGEGSVLNPWDDVYSITGNGSGVNQNDRNFDVTITKPLIKAIKCRWIKEGELELQPEDLDKRVVDFGNGSCDNEVTIQIGNRTYSVNTY